MAKEKKKYAICPSCRTEKHRTEMKTSLALLEKMEKTRFKHYKELGLDPYNSFIDSSFEWACDACLGSGKAILANPGLQNYCWDPHIAYFDATHVCRSCGIDFIFSKEEKRLWYEQLKFWIDAAPVNCPACRKELRQLKRENNTLSEILNKEEDDISSDELQSVIGIYKKWGKDNKVKYYESLWNKRQRT
jgi:hypothetical protein